MSASMGMQIAVRARFPLVFVGAALPPSRQAPVRLALDVNAPADQVIAFAFEEAARRGVSLHVLYVWPSPPRTTRRPMGTYPPELVPAATRQADQLAELLLPWREKWPEVCVEEFCRPHLDCGVPAEAAAGAGLLVLGRRIRIRGQQRVGPTAQAALRAAKCPAVLVAHD